MTLSASASQPAPGTATSCCAASSGFLVVGDAVCSFNPIYGQGMSVAALEALTLGRHLERRIEPQPARWFRDLARVVDVAWNMSAGGDLAFPGVEGHRTFKTRLLSTYLARLHAAAAHDSRLAIAFIRVSGLVAPPQSLLHPSVVLRVLRKGGHKTAVAAADLYVTQSGENLRA